MQRFVGSLHSHLASQTITAFARINSSGTIHLSHFRSRFLNCNRMISTTKRTLLKTSDSIDNNEPVATLPDGTHHDSRVAKGMIHAKEGLHLPQKKFFRQRAHINPLGTAQAYEYPVDPDRMNWAPHYSDIAKSENRDKYEKDLKPDVADVGCGFGGLVVNLAPHFPESLMVGMEIRPKV